MSEPTNKGSILLVEDEPDIADLIQFHLMKAGFHVEKAHNGKIALEMADEKVFDLVILDLMLPKVNGMTVFKELRGKVKTKDMPVIMLTAKGQASDRVAGLEAGADDYITKPFSPKELVLRVQKQLKIIAKSKEAHLLSVNDLVFDTVNLTFKYKGELVDLTSTEFKLLLFLCEKPNQIQSRSTIFKEVWGYSEGVNSRTLDTHMKRLRLKIGDLSDKIQTIRGKGYVYQAED